MKDGDLGEGILSVATFFNMQRPSPGLIMALHGGLDSQTSTHSSVLALILVLSWGPTMVKPVRNLLHSTLGKGSQSAPHRLSESQWYSVATQHRACFRAADTAVRTAIAFAITGAWHVGHALGCSIHAGIGVFANSRRETSIGADGKEGEGWISWDRNNISETLL